jgi:hypothetical protein
MDQNNTSNKRKSGGLGNAIGCLFLVGLVLYILLSVVSAGKGPGSESANTQTESAIATACARREAKNLLTSPNTAEFPSVFTESQAAKLQDGTYAFKSYVESKNALNALVKTNYECNIKVLSTTPSSCETECVVTQ